MPKPKILIISSLANSLVNFRGDFIAALVENDFEVWCAAPEGENQKAFNMLHEFGAKTVCYRLQRIGLNPFKDLTSIQDLKRIMRNNEIDIVFPYTIKPVIYGSIAARQLGIPVFSLITGLGFTFSGVSIKAKLLQKVTQVLYREGLKKNKVTIFQNKDDQQLFLDKKILSGKQKSYVVNGSGINLNRFGFRTNLKKKEDKIIFVIVGRIMLEKGFELFIQAAKQIKPLYPKAEFHIIGMLAENSSPSLSLEIINELHQEKTIVYHGPQSDVMPFLEQSDVFVLPSFYREGVPRSILEALSVGLPIITTKMPGCKETVIPERNGFLIPPQELQPLIEAMMYFIKRPAQISIMGKASRVLAETKFDVDIINGNLIGIIKDNN